MNLKYLNPPRILASAVAGLVLLSQASCTTGRYEAFGDSEEQDFGISSFDGVGFNEVGFDEVDLDGDGLATWSDITARYINEIESLGWAEPDALELFDSDMNGFLDREEYIEFTRVLEERVRATGSYLPADEAGGYLTFDDIDSNSDGLLNAPELEATPLFDRLPYLLFDDNEDGYLDQEEFADYLVSGGADEVY